MIKLSEEDKMSELNFKTDVEYDQLAKSREEDLAKYIEQINQATSGNDLVKVGSEVLEKQKAEEGQYLFPKNGSKQFWDIYKTKKATFQEKAIEEIKTAIEEAASERELRRLKKSIFECAILDHNEHRVPFWAECDDRIDELAA